MCLEKEIVHFYKDFLKAYDFQPKWLSVTRYFALTKAAIFCKEGFQKRVIFLKII